MDNAFFWFEIGKFKCCVINDGTWVMSDPDARKSPTPPGAQSGNRIDIMSLFVGTGEHRILIDTGFGKGNKPDAGKLLQNLEAAGIAVPEMNMLILTHAHPDHLGSNVDGEGHAVFHNARYILHQKDWEYWMEQLRQPEDVPAKGPNILPAIRKNLLPIKYRYETVGEKEEIVPGIKFILTPGHSPGEMVLVIRSGNEQMYCLGDLIHHLKEFDRPDYYSGADISPDQAIASRNRIFSRAAKTGDLVFAGHLPFPGLGYVRHYGDRFSWEPIKIEA